ncbi:carbamate kinase [Butyrivibrio sp. NC3005]|uniref:carbamate kinase n=1 Tax=Butyrivibrio sp. NC3005 TaxID=1280685 RepID=UPI0004285F47|nr:carbamate kinase [Butyrivibrio sp. NC3005]
MENKKAVVSLGHEALGYTTAQQKDAVARTSKALADLVEAGYQLTITHSNGPQVSMIHKAMTELHRIYIDYTAAPMSVCSAMSQGYVGYDLQSSLKSELSKRGIERTVSTILTQVTVDPYDEAFYSPTKSIGRYMNREDADNEIKKGNFVKEVPGKGFLRIVAAPKPLHIVELDAIKLLSDAGQEVIACGGGGIPVLDQDHNLKGASAVIEKDSIAGKLAADLNAETLIILTSVPCVYESFGKDEQKPIEKLTLDQAKEYIEKKEFGEGNMLPKIEAAVTFLEANPKGSVLITSIDRVKDALKKKAGTIITY